jgi:hypothetical protein
MMLQLRVMIQIQPVGIPMSPHLFSLTIPTLIIPFLNSLLQELPLLLEEPQVLFEQESSLLQLLESVEQEHLPIEPLMPVDHFRIPQPEQLLSLVLTQLQLPTMTLHLLQKIQ